MTALVLPIESVGYASLKSLALEGWIRNNILFVDACHRIQILTDKTNTHYYMKIQKEDKTTEYYFYFQNEGEVTPKLISRAKGPLEQVEAFANSEDQPAELEASQKSKEIPTVQSGLVGVQAQQRFKSTYHHYAKLQKILKG